jgi:RNA methyltransferase, TrmH family
VVQITSTHNPVVAYVRSLAQSKERLEEGVYLVEGVRLVREAQFSGARARVVLYEPDSLARSEVGRAALDEIPSWSERYFEVTEKVLAAVAHTESPSGVVAVLSRPVTESLSGCAGREFGLIFDGVADPGNAGAILRTADAVGVGYVVSVPDTVDLFAPKAVRAGMGAHFRLPIYCDVPWDRIVQDLEGVEFVGTSTRGEASIFMMTWPKKTALVIGNEARGLSHEAQRHVRVTVRVPMRQPVESLNAGVAVSVVLYAALGHTIVDKD